MYPDASSVVGGRWLPRRAGAASLMLCSACSVLDAWPLPGQVGEKVSIQGDA
jgi:hypothetical protein